MKTIKMIIISMVVLGVNSTCFSQTNASNTSDLHKANNVEVYYFHYTQRCATCIAVENESRKAVADLYGKKVSFAAYNMDDKVGEAKGKEQQVSGQTLLIVSGDTKIDITMEGFMFAHSNPDKLKQILKEKIDPLISAN